MSFMQPEIVNCDFYEVETTNGTMIVPADLVSRKGNKSRFKDYISGGEIQSYNRRTGWIVRLSAPGYMDCTDWTAFDTEREARDYLVETYGGDTEQDEEDWEENLREATREEYEDKS